MKHDTAGMPSSVRLPQTLNGRFHGMRLTAYGTLPSCYQAQAERQETEWPGRWLCVCQQAGTSLKQPHH